MARKIFVGMDGCGACDELRKARYQNKIDSGEMDYMTFIDVTEKLLEWKNVMCKVIGKLKDSDEDELDCAIPSIIEVQDDKVTVVHNLDDEIEEVMSALMNGQI
ncbi:MAG: hypothetical protein Q8P31_09480, partial [Bacillota bacterium]|nr:hypothetical protein [Bacillota bacterium]